MTKTFLDGETITISNGKYSVKLSSEFGAIKETIRKLLPLKGKEEEVIKDANSIVNGIMLLLNNTTGFAMQAVGEHSTLYDMEVTYTSSLSTFKITIGYRFGHVLYIESNKVDTLLKKD